MKALNKQSCPTCGQSVNERQIALFRGLVFALFKVWKWCEQNNLHEFHRKDIKHLFESENEIARFGDWVLFGGLVYRPEGKASYGLNLERVSRFFAGELQIPTIIWKNPLTKELRAEQYRTISQIPNLPQLLTDNQEFIPVYKDPGKSKTDFL